MAQSFATKYNLPEECQRFFAFVSENKEVQEILYYTKELREVAELAQEKGFSVTTAHIMRAQAGRVLSSIEEKLEDSLALLLNAKRGKSGAQWGRECEGYLDAAGYWLLEGAEQSAVDFRAPVPAFIKRCSEDSTLREKLLACKSFNEVAAFSKNNGENIAALEFLAYQANFIMSHPDDGFVERVANGRGAAV